MDLVYFDESLMDRAPDVMGALCRTDGSGWVDLPVMVAALRNGEPVNIRQATKTEMVRAEKFVALYEIGQQLGATIGSLLDDSPQNATAAVTEFREAMEDAPVLNAFSAPGDLLDRAHSAAGE